MAWKHCVRWMHLLLLLLIFHISRFLGELYILGMLTARIMHEVVRKLLKIAPSDKESLECLCRLADLSSCSVNTKHFSSPLQAANNCWTGPRQGDQREAQQGSGPGSV